MWLAVRANVRVAEAARQGSAVYAVQIAFRTGGVVGMLTVGLGLFGASLVVALYGSDAPFVLEGFGFGAADARDVHACRWRYLHKGSGCRS